MLFRSLAWRWRAGDLLGPAGAAGKGKGAGVVVGGGGHVPWAVLGLGAWGVAGRSCCLGSARRAGIGRNSCGVLWSTWVGCGGVCWCLVVSGRIWSCLVVADRIPGSGVGTGMSTESEPKLALERERCVRVCEAK